MVVERREAQRARSRRFAQADRSVARATPEAWAGGNVVCVAWPTTRRLPALTRTRVAFRARGFSCAWLFVIVALAKLGRTGAARTRGADFDYCDPRHGEGTDVGLKPPIEITARPRGCRPPGSPATRRSRREPVDREERRHVFQAVERKRGDAVGVRAPPGFGQRRAEAEHVDSGRQHRRDGRLPRQRIKHENHGGGEEERPLVPRKHPLAAPEAHQAQQQTNDRGDAHDPAAGAGRLVALHQIGGAGEDAEDQPRQRMRARLAGSVCQT